MAATALVGNMIESGGGPASGCLLNSYIRNTTTRSPLYSNVGLTVQTTNPYVGDADGRLDFYFDSAIEYDWQVTSSDGATVLWEAEVVGGVVTVTYSDSVLIHETWKPALASALGSNWPTALGADLGSGWAALLGASKLPPIWCNTYAQMTAITVAQGLVADQLIWVNGGASKGDGGHGFFRVVAGTTTADGGTKLNHDTLSFHFLRQHEGTFFIEWFGTSANWGAALTAAFTACASAGGVVKMRPGGDYTFTTQASMPATENNVTWDIRGCKLRPKYASGATFKFGDGVTQSQELTILGGSTIIDADSLAGGGVSQAVFEFRGMRSVRIHDIRGSQFHQICKWGDPSDAVQCFNLWIDQCDITMRGTTHTHGILADGGLGGLHIVNGTSIEADATNVASGVNLIQITSAQGASRLDHVVFSGGPICKKWDRVVSAVDARIVNIEVDPASRFDEVEDAAFYIETTSGATKGGVDIARLSGTCSIGKFLRIKADKGSSSISFDDVIVSEVIHGEATGPVVQVTSSGTGLVKSLHIKSLHSSDSNPADANQDCIILDADLDEALVDQVTIAHKSSASFNYRYGIYNNTASTKSVRITRNITMDAYGTGMVYDPNIGDLAINRLCEINTDGTPRMNYAVSFYQTDFATSQTNVAMTLADNVGTAFPVRRRCRVVGQTTRLNAAVAAGSLTIGPGVSTIDTNLDIVMTSGQGGTVDYAAGSAALAAGDLIYARYTSDGSLTANIDGITTLFIQEM